MNNKIKIIIVAVAALTLSFGCSDGGPATVTDTECRVDWDCDIGSYCDPFLNLCGWDCRSDTECSTGEYCEYYSGRCIRDTPAVPDASPVLEVVPGDLSDVTLVAGTPDAEFLRFDIVNHGDRRVALDGLPVSMGRLDYTPPDPGDFTDVKFVDRSGLYTLMGPAALDSTVSGNVYLSGTAEILPGETTSFVLRADIGDVSGRYRVMVGALVGLIQSARYLDGYGERVPAESIRNNQILGRVVEVVRPEDMGRGGATALVVRYNAFQSILHPDGVWRPLGVINLDSYGGDSVFTGTDLLIANAGLLEGLRLERGGYFVGGVTTPIAACSCGTVELFEPETVRAGETVAYMVWGVVRGDAESGEIRLSPNATGVHAVAASGGEFATVVSSPAESVFRIWRSSPVLTPQSLATSVISNGAEQELYKTIIEPTVPGRSIRIRSLTFRVTIESGQTLSGFRVYRGSTELPRDAYTVVRTGTGEDLRDSTLEAETGAQVSIVFNGDLLVTDPIVLSLRATPNGFVSGDHLSVLFGDRSFWHLYGEPMPYGLIQAIDAGALFPVNDPIVWTDGGGRYTGSWLLRDLFAIQTLIR